MGENEVIEIGGRLLTLLENGRQPYRNCYFAAGSVEGHPHDTLYLRLSRDGEPEQTTLLLRPDEAMAVCWVLSGALWADKMNRDLGLTGPEPPGEPPHEMALTQEAMNLWKT